MQRRKKKIAKNEPKMSQRKNKEVERKKIAQVAATAFEIKSG